MRRARNAGTSLALCLLTTVGAWADAPEVVTNPTPALSATMTLSSDVNGCPTGVGTPRNDFLRFPSGVRGMTDVSKAIGWCYLGGRAGVVHAAEVMTCASWPLPSWR
jgi:hypothetical protein